MAITGQNTIIPIIVSTSAGPAFSGTVTVEEGDLVVIHIHAWTSSTLAQPSTSWTVTLDGVTLTVDDENFSTAIAQAVGSYHYRVPAGGGGTKTLSVNITNAGRALLAYGWVLKGFDDAAQIAAHGAPSSYTNSVATHNSPNGALASRDGNVVLSSISIRGGDFSASATVTGADVSRIDPTGTNTTNDTTGVASSKLVNPAASTTITYSWSGVQRVGGLWTEVNVAIGGGSIVSGDGTSAGAAAVSGAGAATAEAGAASSGMATASGTGAATAAASGASAGQAAASGAGASIAAGVGASTGGAMASGAASSIAAGVATAAGAATVTGLSGGATVASAVGTASGAAAASSAGTAIVSAAGASAGVAAITGAGSAIVSAVGASAGVASTAAIGAAIANSVGASAGVTVAQAIGAALAEAVASGAGIAIVTGVSGIIGGSTRLGAFPGQPANSGTLLRSRGAGTLLRSADRGTILQR